MENKVGVVIPARNEANYIKRTLEKLFSQTIKPCQVVVVNDYSKDNTREISLSFGCEVIDFPYDHENWLPSPNLAKVENLGFDSLDKNLDYVMILGADHLICENYIERVTSRMKDRIVIASGKIKNEWAVSPRGSGRIIENEFWQSLGAQYPLNWGYESYPLYKALEFGYDIAHFPDIITTTQRPTGSKYNLLMYIHFGKAMKALGYNPSYALGRSLVISKRKGVKRGFAMYYGYLTNHVELYDEGVRKYVNKTHKLTRRHFVRFINYIINDSLFKKRPSLKNTQNNIDHLELPRDLLELNAV